VIAFRFGFWEMRGVATRALKSFKPIKIEEEQ
jgi:hypothetical protein